MPQNKTKYIQQVIELGINNFDHADIYGDYSCEELFGNALKLTPSLRQKIKLIRSFFKVNIKEYFLKH